MIRESQAPDEAATSRVVLRHGARIGYLTVGTGPSVVAVPGALSTAADYLAFAQALATDFTVHIIERRGRGVSSPQGDQYSIEQERDDLLAVQRETGASYFVGHSFGGLVALEAARGNAALKKIAVYEPGVSIGGSISMDWLPGYERLLAEQKHFDALVEFSRGTGPDRGRRAPRWLMKLLLRLFIRGEERKKMLGLLGENLREHREVARLDNHYEAYRTISADTLLMFGGKSDIAWVGLAIERLGTVLPRSDCKPFPALDHFGINKGAPGEVAAAVSEYFRQ